MADGSNPNWSLTGDADADRLLVEDPLALLLGMLLDQQVPIEWAFAAPARLRGRLDAAFSVRGIAKLSPDELIETFSAKPALHRYPRAMAQRAHALCVELADRYGDDPSELWRTAQDSAELMARLRALPGFGDEKARIFVALLAKRFGFQPSGWREACAPFGDDQPRTVADIDSPEALTRVKAWKQAQRAAGRGKSD